MSRRERETEPVVSGGSSAGSDGLHPIGGGGSGNGSNPETKGPGAGAGGSLGGDARDVTKAPWFNPVDSTDDFISDCPGGVCPVPWASKENPVFTIEAPPKIAEDTVNHPSHYTDGGIECIEAIEAALTIEEFRGYCKANCMKYIWRERHKGGTESLKKARWYLDRLIDLDEVQNG